MENEEKVISKIRIQDVDYEIKDSEARNILDILLGKKKIEDDEENSESSSK